MTDKELDKINKLDKIDEIDKTDGNINENKLNVKNAVLLSLIVAVLVVIAMIYKGGSTEAVHIELDDTIAISANRLGKVINIYSFNDTGKEGISSVYTYGMTYTDALEELFESGIKSGKISAKGKISVRIWTESSGINDRYVIVRDNIKKCAEDVRLSVKCDEFDRGIVKAAKEYGISVGKYRMICEMQKLDPGIKMDKYKDYSLNALKSIYQKLLSGKTREQAENETGVGSGGMRDIINKILYESGKSE